MERFRVPHKVRMSHYPLDVYTPGLSSVQSPQSHRNHYGLAESHPALLSREGRCREEILAEQALKLRLQGINLGLYDF